MAYCKFYDTEREAADAMKLYNNTLDKGKSGIKHYRVMVDGPDDNYAVVDLDTAIDMGMGYQF